MFPFGGVAVIVKVAYYEWAVLTLCSRQDNILVVLVKTLGHPLICVDVIIKTKKGWSDVLIWGFYTRSKTPSFSLKTKSKYLWEKYNFFFILLPWVYSTWNDNWIK